MNVFTDLFASVIITSFNRYSNLVRLLVLLQKQTLSINQFEVIIINDGSSDETKKIISKLSTSYPLVYLEQAHNGPASARNKGLNYCKGEVVVFFDDDIEPMPECLEEHLKLHCDNKHNIVFGKTPVSPHNINKSNYPNPHGFPRIQLESLRYQHKQCLPWEYFITCNLSLRLEDIIRVNGFSPRFPFANYEDLELGYKLYLQNNGGSFIFNEEALAYHFHYRTFSEKVQWAVKNGLSRMIMLELHPELYERCLKVCHYNNGSYVNLLEVELMSLLEEAERYQRIIELEENILRFKEDNEELFKEYNREVKKMLIYYESLGVKIFKYGINSTMPKIAKEIALEYFQLIKGRDQKNHLRVINCI